MAGSPVHVFLASGALFLLTCQLQAKEAFFNPALLEIDHPAGIDIHQFDRANTLPPGTYKVDILINGKKRERREVTFIADKPDGEIQPCFTHLFSQLKTFGVKVDAIKALRNIDEDACVTPGSLVEGAVWQFDTDKLTLNIVIPQIWLDNYAMGYISPDRWDQGINAFSVNYDFSGSHSVRSDYDDTADSYYLNLQNGLNLGAWRVRNYSTLSADGGNAEYHSVSSWLQRDIPDLRSQFMVGDTWSASDIFDGAKLRGVRLYTDDDMLPASMNGFAPVVRGVAKSNAMVTIKQNGYVIYQSAVPQGAFALTDLNTTSSGGDLDVTIKEEDGSEQHFIQPYASLAILKREGQTDFDISLGEMREDNRFTPNVMQAQIMRGLPSGITLYGGMQLADKYRAAAVGVGKDLGTFGALSVDVTQAKAQFYDSDESQGQSYRFLYSKRIDATDTNFRLVGYRYSTQGFYTLNEWSSRQGNESDFWETGNRRSRLEGTWTQSFERGWGNIYLTLSRQQYWQTDAVERLIQTGYSNNLGMVSWNVSWSYTDSATHSANTSESEDNNGDENIFMFSLSVPLSGWVKNSYLNYAMTQNDSAQASHMVGLSGTLLERDNLSYNLQQSWTGDNAADASNLAMTYNGTYGTLDSSYAYSANAERLNFGARGGVIVHDEGVTFSQQLGETVALIKTPGASGLAVENTSGVSTDWRGYAVKTQLNPYDENRVAIDNDYFSRANVELENSVIDLVPTRGAIVKAEFLTHLGYRVLFNVVLANGKPAPFGAVANGESKGELLTGIVGENGQLYLSGVPEKGTFALRWGAGDGGECRAPFQIAPQVDASLIQQTVVCK